MQKRVRGILINDRTIVIIKRVKKYETYYVFPGGGVKKDEDLIQALKREIKEELGVDADVEKLLIEKRFDKSGVDQIEYFYLCKITGGPLGTGDGPEYQAENKYEGTHEPIQLPISDIKDLNLLPLDVKNLVLENYGNASLWIK
ncbi:MAG: DNA mismatch repair protein MutT [Flavobacterium sp.]|nr:DNA mismatch repair protein MutT [Flavobacterium sp.]